VYPFRGCWRFRRVGYYEEEHPANLDGDFLLVQQDKIKEVDRNLRGTYIHDTLTIRITGPVEGVFQRKSI